MRRLGARRKGRESDKKKLSGISQALQALAAYLNITRRTALAIFIASIAFIAAMICTAVFSFPSWSIIVMPIIGFSGTMFFYQGGRPRWEQWKRQRRNNRLAIEAINHLGNAENYVVESIYHSGGIVRSSQNRIIVELERIHILSSLDPLGHANQRLYGLTNGAQKALRTKLGAPDKKQAKRLDQLLN
jgi:hypothetical protein